MRLKDLIYVAELSALEVQIYFTSEVKQELRSLCEEEVRNSLIQFWEQNLLSRCIFISSKRLAITGFCFLNQFILMNDNLEVMRFILSWEITEKEKKNSN